MVCLITAGRPSNQLLWPRTLDTGHTVLHWAGGASIEIEWPRTSADSPIAKLPIGVIVVAAPMAGPIIGGASGPTAPPATGIIVVLALRADPIAWPPIFQRTPCLASSAHQVVPYIHRLALLATPQIFSRMLSSVLLLGLRLLIRLLLQLLRFGPHPSVLAHRLEFLLARRLVCPAAFALPWKFPAPCAEHWDATPVTGHCDSTGTGCR